MIKVILTFIEAKEETLTGNENLQVRMARNSGPTGGLPDNDEHVPVVVKLSDSESLGVISTDQSNPPTG